MKTYYFVIYTDKHFFKKFNPSGSIVFNSDLFEAKKYHNNAFTKDFKTLQNLGYEPKLKRVSVDLKINCRMFKTF